MVRKSDNDMRERPFRCMGGTVSSFIEGTALSRFTIFHTECILHSSRIWSRMQNLCLPVQYAITVQRGQSRERLAAIGVFSVLRRCETFPWLVEAALFVVADYIQLVLSYQTFREL
jgi:hypothetical protein